MSDAHVLFIGQSNMLGWNNTGPADYTPTARVQIWTDVNANGQWDFGDNFNMYVPGLNSGAHKHLNGNWGPELGFIKQWLADNPTGMLWIGKVTEGGSPLASTSTLPDWSPMSVGDMYDKAVFVANSMQWNLGTTNIDAVFYFQGETDSFDPSWSQDYAANFADLMANLEVDINLDTTTPQIGWGRIYPMVDSSENLAVRQAQWSYDNLSPAEVDSFKTWDLTLQPDGIHFDATSYEVIGERFYSLWEGWGF